MDLGFAPIEPSLAQSQSTIQTTRLWVLDIALELKKNKNKNLLVSSSML